MVPFGALGKLVGIRIIIGLFGSFGSFGNNLLAGIAFFV